MNKMAINLLDWHIVASELKDPICHSNKCQIASFSSEATICSDSDCMYVSIFVASSSAPSKHNTLTRC